MKSDAIVNMPKGLILAGYRLSLRGQRLEMLLFSKIPLSEYSMAEFSPVVVTAKEWKSSFPGSKYPYEDLKKAAEEMLNCEVRLEGESEKHLFLDSVECDEKKKRVTLIPNRDLLMKAFSKDPQLKSIFNAADANIL